MPLPKNMSTTVPYICDDARDIIFSYLSPFYLRHLSRQYYVTFVDSLSASKVYRYLGRSNGLFASILAETDLERFHRSRVSWLRSSQLATISPRAFMVLTDNIQPCEYDYIPNGLTYVEKAKIFSTPNIYPGPTVYILLLETFGKDPLKERDPELLAGVIDKRPDLIPLLPRTSSMYYNHSETEEMAAEFDLSKHTYWEHYPYIPKRDCDQSHSWCHECASSLIAAAAQTKTDGGFRNAVIASLHYLAQRQ